MSQTTSAPGLTNAQASDRRASTPSPRRSPLITGVMADRLFALLAKAAAWVTLGLLAAILVSLLFGAWPAIKEYGLGFLVNSEWDPVQDKYGGLVMIYGTLMTSLIALVIAVPVSFGIALFLTELSPAWLKRPLGTAIELLAAVPSIVYGMWGLMVFGPVLATYVQQPLQSLLDGVPYLGALVSGPPVGIGILSAGIILAIMIIPFIASVMRDVFEVTPALLKESAYGLGSGVESGVALDQGRCAGRRHAGPGTCAGRDHGRDLRDRQHEPAEFAVGIRGGQQHHLGPGQRVCRSRRRPAPGIADLSGPGAVLHHLCRAVAVQGAAQPSEKE